MSNPLRHAVPVPAGLILLGVGLAACLLALQWQVFTQNERLRVAVNEKQAAMLPQVGTVVPTLDGVDLTGNPIHLDYNSDPRPTVLLVFSTECGICDANWPYWDDITRQIDSRAFRVVYANISGVVPSVYPATHHFSAGAPVVASLDPLTASAYNANASPVVLLIDPPGKIRKVWPGSRPEIRHDLEHSLALSPKDIAEVR